MFGVYGVVSYSVRQRTVEIGMRMALGATHGNVFSMVVGSGLKLAAIGVVAGGVAALAWRATLMSPLTAIRNRL